MVTTGQSWSEALKAQYLWGGQYLDELVAFEVDVSNGSGGDPNGQVGDSDDTAAVVWHDALYSAVAVLSAKTDHLGELLERYEYDPYGRATIFDSSNAPLAHSAVKLPFLFTGQRLDEETELIYYKNRYYVPVVGRFTAWDQLQHAGGSSFYLYVGGAPTQALDPAGLQLCLKGEPANVEALLKYLQGCSKHMTPLQTEGDCCDDCKGGKVVGRAAGPVGLDDSFTKMLEDVLASKETVCFEVVRGDPKTIGDAWQLKTIDIGDVEKYPASPPKGSPSAFTMCEVLIHILAEQYHAVTTGDGLLKSHEAGTDAQTEYRKDHGQDGTVTSQTGVDIGPGALIGTTTYSNGATTSVTYVNGNATTVTYTEPAAK